VLSGQTASAQENSAIKLIQQKGSIDVEIGGKLFTTYHYADDFVRPFVRPFLWPVRASDGTEVTLDQAQHPPLHPHQRSIWVGHHDVNGANHWNFYKNRIVPKQRHLKFDAVNNDTIVDELLWEDQETKPMLYEKRTLHFVAFPDGNRGIDFTLQFTPVTNDVTFFSDSGDTGLLGVRMVQSITHDPELTNSAGGHGGKQCNLKPADWCDESGLINGKIYGVAILDNPKNPRHPPLWHAHPDARLSADIFSLHSYNPEKYPKGAGNFTIKKGRTETFRYRVIIHAGKAADANLPEKYKDYAAGK
jgi:hypothetical protein